MNKITLSGLIKNTPSFSHEVYGEKFYRFFLAIERESGTKDIIPCNISEINVNGIDAGNKIKVIGEIRTRNEHDDNNNFHLEIYVFVREVLPYEKYDENFAELQGYICKEPIFRDTPLGRQIADLLVASNRTYGKSDYIPAIAWGRNAIRASSIEIGTEIYAVGRLQSREYIKRFPDEKEEARIAYELSLSRIEVLKEMEESDESIN